MQNLLLALGSALVVFLLVMVWLGWIAALLPAVIVFGVVFWLLSRRVGRLVQAEMQEIMTLLQSQQVDEGRRRLEAVKAKYGRQQVMLAGQIDAQIGMLDYLQMKWDDALPRLLAGQWQNWMALTAIGCIHWRKNDRDKAFGSLEKAASAAPKESMVYVVWATLLTKADRRDDALKVIDQGLKSNPDSSVLKQLQATIANKRKIDTKAFGQNWYQFFPEELMQQAMVKGRRTPMQLGPGVVRMAPAFPQPKITRKMRRGK